MYNQTHQTVCNHLPVGICDPLFPAVLCLQDGHRSGLLVLSGGGVRCISGGVSRSQPLPSTPGKPCWHGFSGESSCRGLVVKKVLFTRGLKNLLVQDICITENLSLR